MPLTETGSADDDFDSITFSVAASDPETAGLRRFFTALNTREFLP
ncbi:hypothetical protein [Streptomyces sp. NPDC002403]